MKGCELCPGAARMYCESDQARLCFECDAKVHGANFLVARHSRTLLCRNCQSPTPWKAAGSRLGPAVSVCERCDAGRSTSGSKKTMDDREDEGESGERERVEEDNGGGDVDDVDDDDDEEEDPESEEEEEEEGEEQVVPWTAEPPPAASSSSSEDEETVGRIRSEGLLKRMRENVDLPSSSCFQDQLPCSSSSQISFLGNRTALSNRVRTVADDEATSDSFRPLKDRKKIDLIGSGSHQLSVDLLSFGSCRLPS